MAMGMVETLMWKYEKRLQYPINIKKGNPRFAKCILSQYGGPQGELMAAIRYLNQRYTMPDDYGKALLTDIGTEELAHVEMICTMVYQLLKDATIEDIKANQLEPYYTEHGLDLFPESSSAIPESSKYISAVGNPLADISENMAAEMKAKSVYENLIDLAEDEDVIQPLLYLRQREVVHFNRFKELFERYEKMGYQTHK